MEFYYMNSINVVEIRLTWVGPEFDTPAPHLLRGAIADRFRDDDLFHQHKADGGLVYRYPRIHYRADHSGAAIVGFGDGASSLMSLPWAGLELRIGHRHMTVRDAVCSLRTHVVQPTGRLVRYRFGSPWIPFNQVNFSRYQALPVDLQPLERDRLAVAGLLLGLRGIGVNLDTRLYASFEMKTSRWCQYKDLKVIGFLGYLLANMDLPDGMAIGRAVSHGFGWFSRVPDQPPPPPPPPPSSPADGRPGANMERP